MRTLKELAIKKIPYTYLLQLNHYIDITYILKIKYIQSIHLIQRAWRLHKMKHHVTWSGSSFETPPNFYKLHPRATSLNIFTPIHNTAFQNSCTLPSNLKQLYIQGEFLVQNLDITCPNLTHLTLMNCVIEGKLPANLIHFSATNVYSHTMNFMENCNRLKYIYVDDSTYLLDHAGNEQTWKNIGKTLHTFRDTKSIAFESREYYKHLINLRIIVCTSQYPYLQFPSNKFYWPNSKYLHTVYIENVTIFDYPSRDIDNVTLIGCNMSS